MPDHSTGNLFIDSLSRETLDALLPQMKHVSLKSSQIISEHDEPIERVIFPLDCVISAVLEMSDGNIAEVGVVGRDGMTGIALALGQESSNQRCIVQVPNTALALTREAFQQVIEKYPDFRAFSLRYAQAMLMTSTQMSACNTLHSTNERCARWILMAHDRVKHDEIFLTHDFLSQMLGVRRATVSVSASSLQDSGFISYSRGNLVIRDRKGLESVCCECYFTLEQNLHKLMGYSLAKSMTDGKFNR